MMADIGVVQKERGGEPTLRHLDFWERFIYICTGDDLTMAIGRCEGPCINKSQNAHRAQCKVCIHLSIYS